MITIQRAPSDIWRVVLLGLGTLVCAGALAQGAGRPRIGLVLGGGGARGAAHIGVLQVLREQRIPVDCVAGTSMGGLVTGAMAAGLSPAEMTAAMAGADWRNMFNDNPQARDLSPRERYLDRRFIPGTEMGVTKTGVEALPSVLDGQKVKLFINQLVRSQYGEPLIENMPLPVSIISTDLVTGNRVVFREGSLAGAMRASMSVPGLMAPVRVGAMQLVDGGLVDNVPIDEVRARCKPDIVIAVNVGSPLMKADDIGGIFSVAGQMINILTEQNVTRSLASLKTTDIYIRPDLDGITATDFSRYAEAAARGRSAAEKLLPRLAPLAVDAGQFQAWLARTAPVYEVPPVVDEVQVAGLKRVNPALVEGDLKALVGSPLDISRLDNDLGKIYGTGEFDHVDYALITARNRNILRVMPVEKAFGPDYLLFGLNLNGASQGPSTFNVRAAYQKTWMNRLGGEWLSGVQVGNEPGVFTEFYQPLDGAQRFFLRPIVSYGRAPLSIYQSNQAIAQYRVEQSDAELMAGVNVGLVGPVSIGWVGRQRGATLETGDTAIPSGKQTYGGFAARVNFEQLDHLFVPSQGWSVRGGYFNAAGEGYSKAELDLRATQRSGDYVFHGRLYAAGSPKGTLPFYDAVSLGGFLNLSGFVKNQIIGDSLQYGNVRLERIIGQLPLGLRGDMRAGLALERGQVKGLYTETGLKGWQNSATVYVGGETPLGVVYVGYGYSPQGFSNLYLFLGTP